MNARNSSAQGFVLRLAAAQKLAALGAAPFPAKSGHPPMPGWTDLATDDPNAAMRVMREHSRCAQIGIRTGPGKLGNLVVADIDNKNGKNGTAALKALVAQHGGEFPRTGPCVATPSGGLHYYLRAPDGMRVKNSVSEIADGIDIRGYHGFVVVPPTERDGRAYRWKRSIFDHAIPMAPDWLLPLIEKKEPAAPATPVVIEPYHRNDSDLWAPDALTKAIDDITAKLKPGRARLLFSRAAYLAGFVVAGRLPEATVRKALFDASCANGLVKDDGAVSVHRTISNGFAKGFAEPKPMPTPKQNDARRAIRAPSALNSCVEADDGQE